MRLLYSGTGKAGANWFTQNIWDKYLPVLWLENLFIA